MLSLVSVVESMSLVHSPGQTSAHNDKWVWEDVDKHRPTLLFSMASTQFCLSSSEEALRKNVEP